MLVNLVVVFVNDLVALFTTAVCLSDTGAALVRRLRFALRNGAPRETVTPKQPKVENAATAATRYNPCPACKNCSVL